MVKGNQSLSIRVESYAGYRAEETPRRFFIGKRRVEINEVVDRWLTPERSYYKVCGDDGGTYILRYDATTDGWDMTLFDSGAHSASLQPEVSG